MRVWERIKQILLLHHVAVTILAFVIMSFFGAIAVSVKFFDSVTKAVQEVETEDIYYSILRDNEPEISNNIVLLDITEVYNRAEMAQLMADVEEAGAKVVGIDCCFEFESKGTEEENQALIDVTNKYHDNIVYSLKPAALDNDGAFQELTHSFMYFYVDTMVEGTTNVTRTLYGGLKRTTPMLVKTCEGEKNSWAAQIANIYAGKDFVADHPSELHINFVPTTFLTIQPKDVKKSKDLIKDRIVLFGALKQEEDWHWTPIGKMPGTTMLAYGVQTVLDKKEIKKTPFWALCIIVFLMALLVQCLQQAYLDKMATYKNPFVRYIIGSSYVLNILTFLFTAIFIWGSFLVFTKFNYSIDFAYGIAACAFLGTSRSMYKALKDYYFNKDNKE